MILNINKYTFASLNTAILAVAICLMTNDPVLPLFLTLTGAVLLLKGLSAKHGSIISFSSIFVFFACLYAVSGPFSVLTTGELTAPFFGPYDSNKYLMLHNLGMLGFTFSGIVIPFKKIVDKDYSTHGGISVRTYSMANILVLAFLSSVFELLNFVRVGGLNLLSQGKSVYQGAVADMQLTLPASALAVAAFALAGLLSGKLVSQDELDGARKTLALTVLMSGFEIFQNLVLGQRLELFSYAIAFILGYTTHRSMRRLSAKHILIVSLAYLASVALYSYRWLLPQLFMGENHIYVDYNKVNESMLDSINPGRSEFGAPFGNFTTYNNFLDYPLKLGETYLAGATIPIPSMLFPGEKPLDITYIYRNDASLTNINSSIAGTGFSSLLEAYINFSVLGPFVVYLLIGVFVNYLESHRYSGKILIVVAYLFISPLAMTFHRSGSGAVFSLLSWLPLVWVIMCLSAYFFAGQRSIKHKHNYSS